MEITITCGPISRTIRGSYDELQTRDWHEIVYQVIEDAHDY